MDLGVDTKIDYSKEGDHNKGSRRCIHIRDQMDEDVAPSLPLILDMLLQSVIALFALLPFVASAPQVSDPT
jgi:hypothetical protein